LISKQPEGTLGRLRYILGGDRPSQTTHLTLSLAVMTSGGYLQHLAQGGRLSPAGDEVHEIPPWKRAGSEHLPRRRGPRRRAPHGREAFRRVRLRPGRPDPWPEYYFKSEEGIEREKKQTVDVDEAKKKARAFHNSVTDARPDILVFQTEPLAEPASVAGPLSAVLYASTSAPDTDWFATLMDVGEKGEIFHLVRGTIRARFRNSMAKPELLEKNKIYRYDLDMWQTGITFEKGHRVRVEVASAMFPMFSRDLNTGGHNEKETGYLSPFLSGSDPFWGPFRRRGLSANEGDAASCLALCFGFENDRSEQLDKDAPNRAEQKIERAVQVAFDNSHKINSRNPDDQTDQKTMEWPGNSESRNTYNKSNERAMKQNHEKTG